MEILPNPVPAGPVTISARLDRLPPTPYLRGLIARIAVGGWFEFFDLFMTAYISLGLIKAGIFTATTTGWFDWNGFASFIASGFSGMFIGTLVLSGVSDRYGRKKTFAYSLFCYSIATLVMAFQKSPISLDLLRFIAGLGIGVQLITSDVYISEISPKQSRGLYTSFSLLVSFCAVPAAAFAAYLLIPRTFLGLDGWRWLAMIGTLGAPVYLLIGSQLPESPRWYEARGRKKEAEAAVAQMEAGTEASLGRALPVPQTGTERVHLTGRLGEIWGRGYRVRTVMLIVFNVFQTVGFYGFASWVPLLLMQQGVSFVHSLEYTFAIAIANPLGPLISMKFADALQRKWQIVNLAVASAVFGMIFARMRNPALIILFGSLITIANNWFSCAFHSYQAELYPTRIRAQAVGFVYGWSRFSAIFVGFLIAALLKDFGTVGVFTLIAGSMAIVAMVIAIAGPKTSGVPLELLSR
jgi:putative MFS transporter